MTLQKDKEDQSKYYLSYPKLPVLDMKWENHNINVVESANIPKFTPLLNGDWEKMLCGPWNATPTVKFDIFITISHLLVSRPTLEFTTFKQQVCSTTQMHIIFGNKQL